MILSISASIRFRTDTKVEDLSLAARASGGLLVALYQYRQLLAFGDKGFSGDFSHGGVEPFYPPLPGDAAPDYAKQRVMCEVLRTRLAGVRRQVVLLARPTATCSASRSPWTATTIRAKSTCRTTIRRTAVLPGRMEVRYKDKTYAILNVNQLENGSGEVIMGEAALRQGSAGSAQACLSPRRLSEG